MRGELELNQVRYKKLVTLSVIMLRAAMILAAIVIPVVLTVDKSILNLYLGKPIYEPHAYYIFQLGYSELILGYLLCLFLNFKEEEIFCMENTKYLKRIGKLVILRDFIYLPVEMVACQSFTIKFNVMAWVIGYIIILFSRLIEHGIKQEQKHVVCLEKEDTK